MAKKFQRVFRDRPLTDEEAAADREVREKVQAEFPPVRLATNRQASSWSGFLRKSIQESGKSVDTIASETGVSAVLIANFLAGERDIHLATADRLARSLGLEVTAE